MKDNLLVFSTVTFIQSKNYLCEDPPNEVLSYKLWLFRVSTLLDQLWEVSAFAKLHHKIDWGVFFIHKLIVASNYVVSLHFSQNFDFIVELLFLLFWHASIIGLLPYHFPPTRDVQYSGNFTESTYRKLFGYWLFSPELEVLMKSYLGRNSPAIPCNFPWFEF